MKKVIFVCLLSLSVCLSVPTQQQEAAPASPTATTPNATKTSEEKPERPQTTPTETKTANITSVVPQSSAAPAQNASTAEKASQTTPPSNETSTKTNETKPTDKSNTTDVKPDKDAPKPTEKNVEPAKDKNESMPVVPIHNGTKPDSKENKKIDTPTPKADTVAPTAAPIEAKSRAFDGPSFIGGIILTLGLLAIGFMGFKYYKNQTERNYHTL